MGVRSVLSAFTLLVLAKMIYPLYMSTDQITEIIKTILADFPKIQFATLFGSAYTGRMVASSDVDIAVAAHKKLSVEQRVALSNSLSVALKREVDLVDLNQVSGLILEQAICQSKIVIKNDQALYAGLLKKLWYNQADMMPYVKRILMKRSEEWLQ